MLSHSFRPRFPRKVDARAADPRAGGVRGPWSHRRGRVRWRASSRQAPSYASSRAYNSLASSAITASGLSTLSQCPASTVWR